MFKGIHSDIGDYVYLLILLILYALSTLLQRRQPAREKETSPKKPLPTVELDWERRLRKLLEEFEGGPAEPISESETVTQPSKPSDTKEEKVPVVTTQTVSTAAHSPKVQGELVPEDYTKELVIRTQTTRDRAARLGNEVRERVGRIITATEEIERIGKAVSKVSGKPEEKTPNVVHNAIEGVGEEIHTPTGVVKAVIMTEIFSPPRAYSTIKSLWW